MTDDLGIPALSYGRLYSEDLFGPDGFGAVCKATEFFMGLYVKYKTASLIIAS